MCLIFSLKKTCLSYDSLDSEKGVLNLVSKIACKKMHTNLDEQKFLRILSDHNCFDAMSWSSFVFNSGPMCIEGKQQPKTWKYFRGLRNI